MAERPRSPVILSRPANLRRGSLRHVASGTGQSASQEAEVPSGRVEIGNSGGSGESAEQGNHLLVSRAQVARRPASEVSAGNAVISAP